MASFVQVGTYHINLDQVSCVTETKEGARVFYTFSVADGSYAYDDLKGNEAKLMLALIHTDDDEIERLQQMVNGPKGEPVGEPVMHHPAISVVTETPTGHAIFMTNDFE